MAIQIKNLSVKIDNKTILHDLNLEINDQDVVLLIGPNGHGKSTLLKTIMRHYSTNIVTGSILINNHKINDIDTDKIAKMGVYLVPQYPIEIPGLQLMELLRNEASNTKDKHISVIELYKEVDNKIKSLNLQQDLLKRSVNENFSGGERKKTEILQMQIINPKYIMLDEIDSGLDIDAINTINEILISEKNKGKTIIFISHDEKMLDALKPNKVVLIINGKIIEIGGLELAKKINEIGYKEYALSKGIDIDLNNSDDFLKSTNKGFNCGSKK